MVKGPAGGLVLKLRGEVDVEFAKDENGEPEKGGGENDAGCQ